MWKLVCIGWWTVPEIKYDNNWSYKTGKIDEEIVKLSWKNNPKFLFIWTAHRDNFDDYLDIKNIYEWLWCNVSNLDLLEEKLDNIEIQNKILNSDIIYVGHGSTNFMLEKWRELGVDLMLIEAYNRWIVCCGSSAGSYCWYKFNYDKIKWLWIIDAINCVHYEKKDKEAREKFYNLIKDTWLNWFAIENYVAVEFVDEKMKIIKGDLNKNAYKITYENGEFIEEILE